MKFKKIKVDVSEVTFSTYLDECHFKAELLQNLINLIIVKCDFFKDLTVLFDIQISSSLCGFDLKNSN